MTNLPLRFKLWRPNQDVSICYIKSANVLFKDDSSSDLYFNKQNDIRLKLDMIIYYDRCKDLKWAHKHIRKR